MDWSGKSVLVTGGAGFVGSNLVHALLAAGARVTILDDLFTGRKEHIPTHPNCRFEQGSVTDTALVRKTLPGHPYVIHAAARNIICSTKNPREDFETNIGGTLNLLMAAREVGVERLVYTSSASVYGNPRYLPINEDDPLRTLTPYSVSKLAGENYCMAFYESYGIPVSVLRYSNVYGPFQSPANPYCGVIGKFVDAVLNDQTLHIHGDGNNTRDYTFAADIVDLTLAALASPRSEGLVFNAGTGAETSVVRLCELIMEAAGRDVPVEHVQRRDIDNIRRRVLNIEQARRILHWQPRVPLTDGLRQTIEWVRRHP